MFCTSPGLHTLRKREDRLRLGRKNKQACFVLRSACTIFAQMISICIPIYNYNVTCLTRNLHLQLVATSNAFEILLMDDASSSEYRKTNAAIDLPGIRYIQLNENVGRAKIRNLLAAEAQYPYLIFMDCDSAVANNNYISDYLSYCQPGIVCYGGRIYAPEKPNDTTFLRWKYGVERESMPASERKAIPMFGFCTNNFLIDRNLFQQVRFNEELTGYGHEDTFFGLELLAEGVAIDHIDNALIHLGLEDATIFLEKVENGMLNLLKIEKILSEKHPTYAAHSKLIRTKMLLEKMHIKWLYTVIYTLFKPVMKRNLLGRKPCLFFFDLYRLGYLLSIEKTQHKNT